MRLHNTVFAYGVIAKLFHWVMGLTIIGLLALGLIMTGLEKTPETFELYGIHKALGALVLFAVTARFLWRQMTIVPALPGDMSSLERLAVAAGHYGLYFMMLFMPLVGWGLSSAAGYPVSVFGWFELPSLVEKSKVLAGIFRELHEYGGYVFIVLIVVHVLAALYHHFIRKDMVLRRMLP